MTDRLNYSKHCLRAILGGYRPMSWRGFTRLVCVLNEVGGLEL